METLRVGVDLLSERGVPGGVHTYSNRLIEAMARRIEETRGAIGAAGAIELVVFVHDDFEWLFPAADHPALRLVRSGRAGLGASVRRALQQALLPVLARRAGVDLLHSVNNVLPLAWDGASVVTVHDLSPFVVPRRFRALKRAFLRWAVPASVRRARRVIAVSASTRGDILRWVDGADPRRIAVIGEGADPRFRPERDPEAEAEVRARYSLPGEFLLSVGTAEPGKNLEGLARALRVLRERHGLAPAWVLAGAGGPDGERFLKSAAGLGLGEQVKSLGSVAPEDLPHLYRLATVFIFPSLYEGFGLPVLESLACGAPTITSGVSSMPEVAGHAALRVDPRRPEVMARAVWRLLRSPGLRRRLALRGPLQAARFSWGDAALETLRLYREALEG